MTPFEYVAIAASLILSFSLARALTNLAPIFVSRERYWVHSIWIVLLLANHLTVFFSTGTHHGVEHWTFGGMCLVLIMPVCMLVVASLVVPSARVEGGYQEYFDSVRVPF